jgi:hypothetical protein
MRSAADSLEHPGLASADGLFAGIILTLYCLLPHDHRYPRSSRDTLPRLIVGGIPSTVRQCILERGQHGAFHMFGDGSPVAFHIRNA